MTKDRQDSSKELQNGSGSSRNSSSELKASSEKGPLSFLSGAFSSILLGWLSFLLSKKVVIYFTLHSPHYTSPIAQSIASGIKTLVIGMCFLATFTFGFIGLGLTIVFIRSLFSDKALGDD